MAKNKKYYWLKLKENFFEEKQIKYLRKLPDGDKLVIAYLKMQLKSLRTEGFIKYDSMLPSNIEELSIILDEEINIVRLMINALIQAKAIEILDDGSFYMLTLQDLIGKEGESAERVRKFRENQNKMLQCNEKTLQCNSSVTKCNTEIEIDIEKEIEIEKDKDKNKDIDEDIETQIDKVVDFYNNNFGQITPFIFTTLNDYREYFTDDIIIYALEISVNANVRNLNYIKAILNSWKNSNYKTLIEIKSNEIKRKSDKKEETEEERNTRLIKQLKERFGEE